MAKKSTPKASKTRTGYSWSVIVSHAFSLRIERYFVGLLAGVIFISTVGMFGKVFDGLLLTALFLAVYALAYTIVLECRKLQKHYVVNAQQLLIEHSSRRKQQKVKILLKNIIKHRFDHYLLGGYILTKEGVKHLLFFNTKEDARHVEKALGVKTLDVKKKK